MRKLGRIIDIISVWLYGNKSLGNQRSNFGI